MAVRIRVYPQNGALGAAGLGMGAVSAQTYYNTKLQSQQQVSNLQLGYERALWNERLEKVRLEERLKNPYALGAAGYGLGGMPLGVGLGGALGGVPLGGLPIGGMPIGGGLPIGGIPAGFGGGQSNVTNQTSTGGASQTVTNSNVNNVSSVMRPQVGGWGGGWGMPLGGGFGGGGFLSGLLGALI
jgi:hypothetical protein